MVEELLETFVGVVDAQLFEGVELEDFEAGDIQDTDEMLPLVLGVQGLVDTSDQPGEHTGVQHLGQGSDGVQNLIFALSLDDEFSSDLDLGCAQRLQEIRTVQAEQVSDLLSI